MKLLTFGIVIFCPSSVRHRVLTKTLPLRGLLVGGPGLSGLSGFPLPGVVFFVGLVVVGLFVVGFPGSELAVALAVTVTEVTVVGVGAIGIADFVDAVTTLVVATFVLAVVTKEKNNSLLVRSRGLVAKVASGG